MKQKLIAASLVFLLAVPFLFGCNAITGGTVTSTNMLTPINTVVGHGFEIYLTRDNVPPAQMDALSHVYIAETPVISGHDIVSYNWETHDIVLTAEAWQRVQEIHPTTTGASFVVCVDKAPVYGGAFWTPVSSAVFNGVIIMTPLNNLPENTITLALGYPESGFFSGEDPRSNPLIKAALEKAGKLKG
jgi:hypothetical protein